MKRSPDQHGGRDVRAAAIRVAPAAVVVLLLGQPVHGLDDQLAEVAPIKFVGTGLQLSRRVGGQPATGAALLGEHQRTDRGGGRQRGAGEFSHPVPRRGALGEQIRSNGAMGGSKPLAIQVEGH